eukprot:GHVN01053492.1.p1 GENE.GHVN01053492.1~~GHVN01053492.1.p1  ORF type:complete len:2376 (+),score=398.90 GHVN01053492.1:854-7981(+)
MGAADMEGRPFYEPTHELAFIKELNNGRFTVLQIPTQVAGVKRWQIFSVKEDGDQIESFNLEVSDDGLFNPLGTILYTSPDPKYSASVLEREPGKCPFTGLALIPAAKGEGFAESCIHFDGKTCASLEMGSKNFALNEYTVELWVCADDVKHRPESGLFATSNTDKSKTLQIHIDGDNNYRIHHSDCSEVIGEVIPNQWTHLAVSYDGERLTGYVDGVAKMELKKKDMKVQVDVIKLGTNRPASEFFHGKIDEVRVWNYERSPQFVREDSTRRLIGDESGLRALYRFDEGSGRTINDQSENGNTLKITKGEPRWVPSEAPISDHPSMRRSYFSFNVNDSPDVKVVDETANAIDKGGDIMVNHSGRRIAIGGLSAKLFYQQENAVVGYTAQHKPMKRSCRVLLVVPTGKEEKGEVGGWAEHSEAYAAIDFAVSRFGRLAQVPDVLNVPVVKKPEGATDEADVLKHEQSIVQLEREIAVYKETVIKLKSAEIKKGIEFLESQKETIKRNLQGQIRPLEPGLEINQSNYLDYVVKIQDEQGTYLRVTERRIVELVNNVDEASEWTWNAKGDIRPVGRNGLLSPGPDRICRVLPIPVSYGYRYEFGIGSFQSHWSNPDNGRAQNFGMPWRVPPSSFQVFQKGMFFLTCDHGCVHVYDGDRVLRIHRGYPSAFRAIPVRRTGDEKAEPEDILRMNKEIARIDSEINKLSSSLAKHDHAASQLTNKSATLANLKTEATTLSAGCQGDVAIPMGHIFTDINGLTTSGALLSFCRSSKAAYLCDSAVGKVAMYYQSVEGRFMSNFLDTNTCRARHHLPLGDSPNSEGDSDNIGLLAFTARSAGAHANDLIISIKDGKDQPIETGQTKSLIPPERCTLIIVNKSAGITEIWTDIPRSPHHFAKLINGQSPLPSTSSIEIIPATLSTARGSSQVTVAVKEVNHMSDTTPMVVNTTDSVSRCVARGVDCSWKSDAPGQAFYFDGDEALLSTIGSKQDGYEGDEMVKRYDIDGASVTMEMWVNPGSTTGHGRQRLLHHLGPNSGYWMGLEGTQTSSSFDFGIANINKDKRVHFPLHSELKYFGKGFTVEFWMNFEDTSRECFIIDVFSDDNNNIKLNQQRDKINFSGKINGETVGIQSGSTSFATNTWHHIALVSAMTRDKQGGVFKVTMFVDAHPNATTSGKWTKESAAGNEKQKWETGRVTLGGRDNCFMGLVDEVRLWDYPKSIDDITGGTMRRAYAGERGLLAHYTLESDGEPVDRSGNGLHGTAESFIHRGESCNKLGGFRLLCGMNLGVEGMVGDKLVGERSVRSEDTLRSNQWNHVACVHTQSFALKLDGGNDYLDCGTCDSLNLIEDFTVEMFLQLNQTQRRHGLISKGTLGTAGQSVPYQLAVEAGGELCFCFEDDSGKQHSFKSTMRLTKDKFHRIAVTRRRGHTQSEKKATKQIEFTDGEGKKTTQEIDMIESVDLDEWFDVSFYIDNRAAGLTRHTLGTSTGHTGNLEIGRVLMGGGRASYADAIIGEIRMWRVAIAESQLHARLDGQERGLAAWWRFEEDGGNTAIDSKGQAHAKMLQGVQRVKNPDPLASELQMLINGVSAPFHTVSSADIKHKLKQFSLGGLVERASSQGKIESVTERFSGVMEEVRVWRTRRSEEQILDNLFGRIKGEKQDLLCYYPFDNKSTRTDSTQLWDASLRGFHLPLRNEGIIKAPRVLLSTAPISSDVSMVRSSLSGIHTAFHRCIDGTPSVVEYGDVQRSVDGGMMKGVMKRCYAYIHKGRWQMYTGFKVGDLKCEWIGQAQYDPQVVGFVEGCPPVPSENLTDGAMSSEYENYSFISTLSNLKMVEASKVSYSVSSTTEGSVDGAFDASLSANLGNDTLLITAPLGFGIGTKAADIDFTMGLKGHFEGGAGWANEQVFGTSINREHNLDIALGGSWEPPEHDKQLNHAVGRRFLSGNVGFALVQSETADVFAIRLAHNNALVSLKMQPNPDTPKDWNLIPFPINPRYVKQGTLDGRVGYDDKGAICLDPDYSNAIPNGEYSYFKPREAYALKKRIQRNEQQLRSFYEAKSSGGGGGGVGMGTAIGSAASMAMQVMSGSSPEIEGIAKAASHSPGEKSEALPDRFSKRDLVNTYVWTADGGFFAETTETSDVRTSSTSGSFNFGGSVGGTLSTDVEVFSIGFSLEMDAAVGASYSTSRVADKTSEKTFSIELTVDPPGDLQVYKPKQDGKGMDRIYDSLGNPVNAAGKVDAYRFMTFYLDSDSRNFEDLYGKVVDPIWLSQSTSPNALALRQANQSAKKPACWRVLHRVTFVSRLLPDFEDPTAAPLEAAMKLDNINSNWQLIRKLAPFVQNKTSAPVLFADAVRTALKRYLPELLPHEKEIEQYLRLYYGITE